MRFNTVYVRRDYGGFTFGLDAVTPVLWYFTTRRATPKLAYRGFSLADADPAKVSTIANPFIGSLNELKKALK